MRPVRAQRLTLVMLVAAALSPGCTERVGGYLPISSLAKDGFARNGESVRQLNGRTVRVWGFVDDRNLYADSSARPILGNWWGDEGHDPATWRFDLMAKADDQVGQGVQVHVANDQGRDDLLRAFADNAREGKPTRVFVEGRLFTFDAPTNAITLTDLYLKVGASQGVRLQPRE